MKSPLLACLIISLVGIAARADDDGAGKIFDQREKIGEVAAEVQLRQFYAAHPDDWRARYYLASVLIESADSAKPLGEALTLLDGAEKVTSPPWIPAWSLARRVQISARLQQLTQRDFTALTPDQISHGERGELATFLKFQLDSVAGTLQLLGGLVTSAEASNKTTFTGDEIRADLHQAVDLLRARWAYVEAKQKQTGLTLDDLLNQALLQVQPQMSRTDASALLRRFACTLMDGHTCIDMATGTWPGIMPASAKSSIKRVDTSASNATTILRFRAIDTTDGVVIFKTGVGAETLQPGDRLLEVDGRKVEDLIAEKGAFYPVSTAAARRAHGILFLSEVDRTADQVPVRIERGGVEQVVPCKSGDPVDSMEDRRAHWISSRLLSPSVGYVQVRTWAPSFSFPGSSDEVRRKFFQPYYDQIDAALAPLRQASDIIVDVRANGGGYDPLCCYFGSYFISQRPISPYILRYLAAPGADGKLPEGTGLDGYFNPTREPAKYLGIQGPPWKSHVWLLVDEGCFSATDTFLDLLTRQMPPDLIRTVGRPSSGGIGGPETIGVLKNTGATLIASTCQAYSLDGELLEGHPARIDLPVRWTRDDVLHQRDADLTDALQAIVARTSSGTSAVPPNQGSK